MKKTLILQCPGMVCSPPMVSKCLGEAHRRLDIIYIIYITLHYITLQYITLILFFFSILLVIFFKCNRTIGSRSIGHRVWSMSLKLSEN